MWLQLRLPSINEYTSSAAIKKIHASQDVLLSPGSKLFDLTIDISAFLAHDCPPLSHYRIVLRDRAWLRRLLVAPGDAVTTGAVLALLSTEEGEQFADDSAREARIAVAGILAGPDW